MGVTKFHILTLFPQMILQGLAPSVIGRAVEKGVISLNPVDIRGYTLDRHGKVDDYPYGGGAGMLMQAQPVYDAYRAVTEGREVRTVYVTPQGRPFTQKMAADFAGERELVFLCGHYEGIDERVLEKIVTDEVSIGDYVLTGGELPAMVMIDAIARLIPGVLGNDESAEEESFHNHLLEYPQYSRPEVWQGERVPQVLLSGDHRKVAAWRLEQSRQRTAQRRPDLYERYQEKQQLIARLAREKRNHIHMMESLARGRGEVLYAEEGAVLIYDSACRLCMAEAVAADEECSARQADRLADRVPEETRTVLTSEAFLREAFAERKYKVTGEYAQLLYTRKETLPMRHKNIRPLTPEDLSSREETPFMADFKAGRCFIGGDSAYQGRDYIGERIQTGNLYGAFAEEALIGCIAQHSEGHLGMPYIKAEEGKPEIGSSLMAYAVNRLLERGWTPYVQLPAENRTGAEFLESLGFYPAKKTIWRLEKVLANVT